MGSLAYMAPEALSTQTGGRHTDWWALGVLTFELMTGRSPWSSLTDKKQIRAEIGSAEVKPPRRSGTKKASKEAGRFVLSLLRRNVAARLGTGSDSEVQRAKFFAGVDWRATESRNTRPVLNPGAAEEDIPEPAKETPKPPCALRSIFIAGLGF